MPFESAKYSCYSTASLDRRNVSSSNRWKNSSSLSGSSSLYISSYALSGLDTSCTYEPSPLPSSLSMYLPPRSPTPASCSSRTVRPSQLSSSRDYRSSHSSPALPRKNIGNRRTPRSEFATHGYFSQDSTSFHPASESTKSPTFSYYSASPATKSAYIRSLTTDLTANVSTTNFSTSYPSRTTYSSYGSALRNNYRPIFIERPSLADYVPRPKEERDKLPGRAIRRDRPLIKFIEREDLNPAKVRTLLNAWAKEESLEEGADEYRENRKRDSIRSDDSGIGSFRSSRRSRQKSGELSGELCQECYDQENAIKDRRSVSKGFNASIVDEGVHLETEDVANRSVEAPPSPCFSENATHTNISSILEGVANDAIAKPYEDHAEPDLTQARRRVRINADKYVISFDKKENACDENNNLNVRNLNTAQKVVDTEIVSPSRSSKAFLPDSCLATSRSFLQEQKRRAVSTVSTTAQVSDNFRTAEQSTTNHIQPLCENSEDNSITKDALKFKNSFDIPGKNEQSEKSEPNAIIPVKRETLKSTEVEKSEGVRTQIKPIERENTASNDKKSENEKIAQKPEDNSAPKLIKSKTPEGRVSPSHSPRDATKKRIIKPDREDAELNNKCSPGGESKPVDPTPTAGEKVSLSGEEVQLSPESIADQKLGAVKPESKLLSAAKKDVFDPGIKSNEKKRNHEFTGAAKPILLRSKVASQAKEDEKGESYMRKKLISEKTEIPPSSKLVKNDPAALGKKRKKESQENQSKNLIEGESYLRDRKVGDNDAHSMHSESQTVKTPDSPFEVGRVDAVSQSPLMSQKPEFDKRQSSAPDIKSHYGQKLQKSSSADAVQIAEEKTKLDATNIAGKKPLSGQGGNSDNSTKPVDPTSKNLENEIKTTMVLGAEAENKNLNKARRSTTTEFPTFKTEEMPNRLQKSFTTDCSVKKMPAIGVKFERPPIPLSQVKKFEKSFKTEGEKKDTKTKTGKECNASKAENSNESIPCKVSENQEKKKLIKLAETDSVKITSSDVSANDNKEDILQEKLNDDDQGITKPHGTNDVETGGSSEPQIAKTPNSLDRKVHSVEDKIEEKGVLISPLEGETELKNVPASDKFYAHVRKGNAQISNSMKSDEIQKETPVDKVSKEDDKVSIENENTNLNEENESMIQTQESKENKADLAENQLVLRSPPASEICTLETTSNSDFKLNEERKHHLLHKKDTQIDNSNILGAAIKKAKPGQVTSGKLKRPETKEGNVVKPAKINGENLAASGATKLLEDIKIIIDKEENGSSNKKVQEVSSRFGNKDLFTKHTSSDENQTKKIGDKKMIDQKLTEKGAVSVDASFCDSKTQENVSCGRECKPTSTRILDTPAVSSNETKSEKNELSFDDDKSLDTTSNFQQMAPENNCMYALTIQHGVKHLKMKEIPVPIKEVTKMMNWKQASDFAAWPKGKEVITSAVPEAESKLYVSEVFPEKTKAEDVIKKPADMSDAKVLHSGDLEYKSESNDIVTPNHAGQDPKSKSTTETAKDCSKILSQPEKIAAKKKKVKAEGDEGKVKDKPKKLKKKKIPKTSPELKNIPPENLQAGGVYADHGFQIAENDQLGATGQCDRRDARGPQLPAGPDEYAAQATALPSAVSLDDLWFDYIEVKAQSPPPVRNCDFGRKPNITDFNLLKVLGRGSYGKVMLAEMKGCNQPVAIKCLKKNVVQNDQDVESTMIEREVLALAYKHPFLCKMLCTFQNESHLFFVMEYLPGGDIMFHLQQSGKFDPNRARFYAAEVICALQYLHKYGIIYRDAKLDNICLDADGHVRLVDFGFCKMRINRKERLPKNICGTPDYMAPEIIRGFHYNQSVDWWSFGVLLYEMLCGVSPFRGSDESELFWIICNDDVSYPWFITREAKHLMQLLFERDPEKRFGMPGCEAGEIRNHAFFSVIDWDKAENKQLIPPFKPQVVSRTDVSNFDADFINEPPVLTPTREEILRYINQEQFRGFSYMNEDAFTSMNGI